MTEKQAAQFLIERVPFEINKALRSQTPGSGGGSRVGSDDSGLKEKLASVTNRLALQVFSVPSLQAFLSDFSVTSSDKEDGSIIVQFDFMKLPKEVIPELDKLLSVDQFKDHRLLKYIKNGEARTGLEITISPKDLPGSAYDYSF